MTSPPCASSCAGRSSGRGTAVLQASEPAEALALATINARAIDLVVTDVRFERGSGLTLVEDLIERGLDLPVLYLSGLSEPPG